MSRFKNWALERLAHELKCHVYRIENGEGAQGQGGGWSEQTCVNILLQHPGPGCVLQAVLRDRGQVLTTHALVRAEDDCQVGGG